ncbi:MAG: hypothetical protein PHN31_03985 [Candidatus Gracilibacteria bacterium]|nr:hypothetical protein [Candidatus Gracilibacteria bacterium]
MKVYYFLNNTSREGYRNIISKINLLLNGEDTISSLIEKYYNKVGIKNKEGISDANFLEALSFIEFLSEKNKKNYEEVLASIKWVYDDNFFIYNEAVYVYENDSFQVIDTINSKVYFVTSRDSFSSPFFLILNSLSNINKNIKIVKFNFRLDKWNFIDKAYYISKLYEYRENFIGNIVFPFFQNNNTKLLREFFKYVKKLVGNRILIKQNFGDMGNGLRALDIDDLPDDRLEMIKDKFFAVSNNNYYTGIYIVPYVYIKKEYRIYYRYDQVKNKIYIYSVKNRINNIGDEVFTKSSMKIYDKIDVIWQYMDIKLLKKEHIDFINKICIIIKDNCGVLEFFEDYFGNKIFCEINSLGGSLTFSGKDEKNMLQYYKDSWKMIY